MEAPGRDKERRLGITQSWKGFGELSDPITLQAKEGVVARRGTETKGVSQEAPQPEKGQR